MRENGAKTDKRSRILDAAETLFADRGFAGTTTKAIAEEAGVATGLVFYYFASKEAILDALIEGRTLASELPALLNETYHEHPYTMLVGLGLRILRTLEERQSMVRILLNELATRNVGQHDAAHLGVVFHDGIERLSGQLRKAVDEGRLEPLDVEMVAETFLSSLLFRALFGGTDAPESFVVRVVGTLLPARPAS